MKAICPECGEEIKVDNSLFGKRGDCPKCGTTLEIPYPVARLVPEKAGKSAHPEEVRKPEQNQNEVKVSDVNVSLGSMADMYIKRAIIKCATAAVLVLIIVCCFFSCRAAR